MKSVLVVAGLVGAVALLVWGFFAVVERLERIGTWNVPGARLIGAVLMAIGVTMWISFVTLLLFGFYALLQGGGDPHYIRPFSGYGGGD
jgi:hypothetical protein